VLAISLAIVPESANADPVGTRTLMLGRSVDGRPIVAVESGDFDSAGKALVVGCIHGNEPAGIAIAERLVHGPPPRELDLWIVPVLNPDGVAAGTRQNADHVDLNRNFPYRWQRLSGIYYSGPYPLSEPESRIAVRLVARIDPAVSIWFHQHLDVVDESGGKPAIERRFAALTRMRLERLPREPGSAVDWENHRDHASTAFVVELPAGSLPLSSVERYADAVVSVASAAAPG
jgi:protein MpaA